MTRWEDQRVELSKAACTGVYRSADGEKSKGGRRREGEHQHNRGDLNVKKQRGNIKFKATVENKTDLLSVETC